MLEQTTQPTQKETTLKAVPVRDLQVENNFKEKNSGEINAIQAGNFRESSSSSSDGFPNEERKYVPSGDQTSKEIWRISMRTIKLSRHSPHIFVNLTE